MKKLSLIAMAAAALVGSAALTGCVQSYPNDEVMIDLSEYYLVGCTSVGWAFDTANQFTQNADGNYEVTWTAIKDSSAFAISENSWTTQYRSEVGSSATASVTVGDTDVLIDCQDTGFGNNASFKGLVADSSYTLTITTEGAYVKVLSLVCNDGASSGPTTYADVSVLNSTTAVQEGAYLKLEGTNCGIDPVYAYFHGSTTAVAYFEIPSDATFSVWGQSAGFAAWFQFYAGDGVTLGNDVAQYNCSGETTVGTAVAISKGTSQNLVLTDAAVGHTYKMTVATTADGATITVELVK